MSQDTRYGTIRRLKPTYGFVMDAQTGQDRFFHWSAMNSDSPKGFHQLREGMRVKFVPHEETLSDGAIKPQAQEVFAIIEVRQPKQEKPS